MSGRRPAPLTRSVLHAPVLLYDHGLGWLLGTRFLCLTHVGRRSGRRYRTVLEVLGPGPAPGETAVLGGLGPGSDWYRNIQANSSLEVTIGRHTVHAVHRTLEQDEAVAVLAGYERRNRWVTPLLRRILSRLVGWEYDGSAEGRRRLVGELPVVAFRPAHPGSTRWPTGTRG